MWHKHFISAFIRSFVVVKTAQPEHYRFVWPASMRVIQFDFIWYPTRLFWLIKSEKPKKHIPNAIKNLQHAQTQTSSHTTISVEVFNSVKNSHTLKLPSSKVMHAILSHCHRCDTKHNNSILHVDCMGLCVRCSRPLHSVFSICNKVCVCGCVHCTMHIDIHFTYESSHIVCFCCGSCQWWCVWTKKKRTASTQSTF